MPVALPNYVAFYTFWLTACQVYPCQVPAKAIKTYHHSAKGHRETRNDRIIQYEGNRSHKGGSGLLPKQLSAVIITEPVTNGILGHMT